MSALVAAAQPASLLAHDPLAVCACLSPLCTDAEHAAGKCARCVKREALRAKLLCACGAKLAVTSEVLTGWCVPCQARPIGFRLSAGYEALVKQLEAEREPSWAEAKADAEERQAAMDAAAEPIADTLGAMGGAW